MVIQLSGLDAAGQPDPVGRMPSALTMNRSPIGVFDSGVGGLSVLRAIRDELPAEDLVYVADSGYAPYGDRDSAYIVERTTQIARFLVGAGVKAIAVACNTATVVAVNRLREWCPVPVVAIEPAIKPAAKLTRTGVVGVLATRQTLASASVARLCEEFGNAVRFVLQPCPGLVEQVESANLDGARTRELVLRYVGPLLAQGADTIVLGCTHYPFLGDLIRELAGPRVSVVDPSTAVARELARRLGTARVVGDAVGGERFFSSSGDLDQAAIVVSRLWGREVRVEALV
jgi:glutamate racemase